MMQSQQNAFLELFPKLKSGGLYIIEDLRLQPSMMEKEGITKTAELFGGYSKSQQFSHVDKDRDQRNISNILCSIAAV